MGTRGSVLAIVAAFASFAIADTVAQSGPSFDCATARNVTERVICAEPELARVDREMAAIWRRALAAAQTATDRETLARDQVEWLKGRDEGCFLDDSWNGKPPPPAERSWSVSCLTLLYSYRTSFLEDVVSLGHVPGPNSGAAVPSLASGDHFGRYASGGFGWYGTMTITSDQAGLAVSIESEAGPTAHFCRVAGKARIIDGKLVALAYHDEDQPKDNERCTLVLTPAAGGFTVEGQEAEQCRFFCGARGNLSGHYYRTPPSRR